MEFKFGKFAISEIEILYSNENLLLEGYEH